MARDEIELLEMGARIEELRAANGFKQQWIADQIGVRLRTYQFWQAGKSPPGQENLEKLAKLFKVTPKYILKGETPEPLAAREDQLDRIEDQLKQLTEQIETMRLEAAARALAVIARLDEALPPAADSRRQRRA